MEHNKEAEAVYVAQEDSHVVMSEKVSSSFIIYKLIQFLLRFLIHLLLTNNFVYIVK